MAIPPPTFTGLILDWKDEIPANLWLFPRGIERRGEVGPNSVRWPAKYGSVLASVFSVIRNALVPFGISSEAEPNISSTRWPSLNRRSRLCLLVCKTYQSGCRRGVAPC
jgi:penicillin V acylase-like amidase (Ntn superfamily)